MAEGRAYVPIADPKSTLPTPGRYGVVNCTKFVTLLMRSRLGHTSSTPTDWLLCMQKETDFLRPWTAGMLQVREEEHQMSWVSEAKDHLESAQDQSSPREPKNNHAQK